MRKTVLLLCLVILAACGPHPATTKGSGAATAGTATTTTASALPILDDDPQLGVDDAPVTVVMWTDTSCTYCLKHYPTWGALVMKYREKLRIVWKDGAYDAQGREEAVVGRAVQIAKGNKAFWLYVGALLDGRSAGNSPTALDAARSVGVDELTIAAVRSQAEARIDAAYAEFKALHVKGLPTTFIDGEAIVGAQPQAKFEAVIDAHLAEGAEMRARGVPAAGLYAELVRIHYRPLIEESTEYVVEPEVWRVPVGQSPVRGPNDALVTVVTFVDFDCQFSKKLQATLQKLVSTYGAKLRVVYEFDAIPTHTRAFPAATLALEARKQKGDAGFWAAHDQLFESAPKLSDEDLSTVATAIGLDAKKVLAAIAAHADDAALEDGLDVAADLGIEGTPQSYVNGRKVAGAQKYEVFQKLVDEELAKAEARVKAGTPKAKVYEAIMASASPGLPPLAPVAAGEAPMRGAAGAKVVIQLFGDLSDRFTRQVLFPVRNEAGDLDPKTAGLRAVLDAYGDKVKIVFRHFPLSTNPRAEPLAELTIDAFKQKGDATFWKLFEDVLRSAPALADDDVKPLALKHGLDWKHAQQVMFTHEYKAIIARDLRDGAASGVTGVPTFFINGRRLVGALPFDAFKRRIDKELAKPK